MTTLSPTTGGTFAFTRATGNWPYSALDQGPSWHTDITLATASSDSSWNGFRALIAANDEGGVWMENRKLSIYIQGGGGTLLVQLTNAGSWSANTVMGLTVRLATGTNGASVAVTGLTSGNETKVFTWSTSNHIFTNVTCGFGVYGGGGFNISGSMTDLDDASLGGVLAQTISAPTLSAAGDFRVTGTASPTVPAVTVSAAGVVPITGAASPTVGPVTLSGSSSLTGQLAAAIDPVTIAATATNPRTGSGSPTIDPVTLAGVGTNPRTGAAAVTLDPITLSAAGGPALSVGVGAVAQQLFNGTPVSGTLSTSSVTTQSDGRSLYVMGVARGLVSRDDSAPFDNKDTSSKPPTLVTKNFYNGYPNSNASVWYKVGAAGGAGTQFQAVYPEISPGYGGSDEVTVWGLEIIGATQLDGYSWVERAVGSASITSASLTLTGDKTRMLVGIVYGNAGTGQVHTFTFDDLTKQTSICAEGDPSSVGYIQISGGTRLISTAGTYTFTARGTSNEGGQMILMAFSASGMIGGGSATVDAPTISATAVMSRLGSGAPSVPAVTASGAGQVLVKGALASTIPAVTGSGAGGVLVSGSASASVPSFTIAADGRVYVMGGASLTIDPVTLAASAIVPQSGVLASTLSAPGLVAAGRVEVRGSGGPSVPPVTLEGLASSGRIGTAAATLPAFTLDAAGDVEGVVAAVPAPAIRVFLSDPPTSAYDASSTTATLRDPAVAVWIVTDQESP